MREFDSKILPFELAYSGLLGAVLLVDPHLYLVHKVLVSHRCRDLMVHHHRRLFAVASLSAAARCFLA